MKRSITFAAVVIVALAAPVVAQGCEKIVCGPESGSGGGTGCWNCEEDCCWNMGCEAVGGDYHCVAAGHNEQGDGIRCDEVDDFIDGCHRCSTSGGSCLNTDVYG